jgi:hypothetical protein
VDERVVANTGPKLHNAEPGSHSDMHREGGTFLFRSVSMPAFAEDLSTFIQVDRPVLDRTGPKLEARKGPIEMPVVDHVEIEPTEN